MSATRWLLNSLILVLVSVTGLSAEGPGNGKVSVFLGAGGGAVSPGDGRSAHATAGIDYSVADNVSVFGRISPSSYTYPSLVSADPFLWFFLIPSLDTRNPHSYNFPLLYFLFLSPQSRTFNATSLDFGGDFHFIKSVSKGMDPYVGAGLGIVSCDFNCDAFKFLVHGGLRYKISPIYLFLEGEWQRLSYSGYYGSASDLSLKIGAGFIL